jgi:hypothetical protein
LFGLNSDENTCFPVHSTTGLIIVGGGISICSFASAKYAKMDVNCSRVRNRSLFVIKNDVVKKS